MFLDEIIQQERATLSWLQNQTKHEEEERKKNERLEKEKLIEVRLRAYHLKRVRL